MKVLEFLYNRPVAVSMFCIGLLILGLVSLFQIPVALLPEIPIGKIIVKTDGPGFNSRDVENKITRNLRLNLSQVNEAEEISSESSDNLSVIKMQFPYGTDMKMAFIECNEQIDRAMAGLPGEIKRPRVMHVNESDIPVFYLTLGFREGTNRDFFAMSRFAQEVLRRRLEQLEGVAFVDISGTAGEEIILIPDSTKFKTLKITSADIQHTLGNILHGNAILNLHKEEQFFKVMFRSPVRDVADLKKIRIEKNGKSLFLNEICSIEKRQKPINGSCLVHGKPGISMAIIRQSGSRLGKIRQDVNAILEEIQQKHPEYRFELVNDQSRLLDLTLRGLQQSLLLGLLFAMLLVLLFMKNRKIPWLVVLSIPVALIISVLFFFLAGLSVNIISLSGIILGIGMMIDNSIIVVDNISRKHLQYNHLKKAVLTGTSEVFLPLLSSVLTTTGIFIPLIFMSGIAGVLFFDQAAAIAIALLVSLAVSTIVIPVLYGKLQPDPVVKPTMVNRFFLRSYEQGFGFFNRHQTVLKLSLLLLIFIGAAGLFQIEHRRMPEITRLQKLIAIDWNEPLVAEENQRRLEDFYEQMDSLCQKQLFWIGRQDFFLEHIPPQQSWNARLFLDFKNRQQKEKGMQALYAWFSKYYPNASVRQELVPNVFDYVFADEEPDLNIKLYYENHEDASPKNSLQLIKQLDSSFAPSQRLHLGMQEYQAFGIDPKKLQLRKVMYNDLIQALQFSFERMQLASMPGVNKKLEIVLQNQNDPFFGWERKKIIPNRDGFYYSLEDLGDFKRVLEWDAIYADAKGTFLPYTIRDLNGNVFEAGSLNAILQNHPEWSVAYSGKQLDRKQSLKEIFIILLVAIALMYFILAAQFESLVQPLIILLEIPVNFAGIALMLYLFNSGLNVISMIGMVVMAGIVINDSILKIDTINKLRLEGYSVDKAVHEAGRIRLRPILMTSFTTMLALVPFLFMGGIGNELQRPLALTIIGGLGLGTFVSMLAVPFLYKWITPQNDS